MYIFSDWCMIPRMLHIIFIILFFFFLTFSLPAMKGTPCLLLYIFSEPTNSCTWNYTLEFLHMLSFLSKYLPSMSSLPKYNAPSACFHLKKIIVNKNLFEWRCIEVEILHIKSYFVECWNFEIIVNKNVEILQDYILLLLK